MRWFVNWKYDIFFFFVPYWITWLVIFQFSDLELDGLDFGINSALIIWILVEVILDGGHAWLTLYRTFWDKHTVENHGKQFLLGIPVLCFVVLFVLSLWSIEVTLRFLFYSSLYHGVKQLFGISSLYFAKNLKDLSEDKKPKQDIINKIRKWDLRVLVTSFYIPFIYWHFNMKENHPLQIGIPRGYFVETFVPLQYQMLPWPIIGKVLFTICFSVPLIYWGLLNFYQIKAKQWIKIIWTLTNSATFLMIFVFKPYDYLIAGGLLIIHAIAYFGIVALCQYRNEKLRSLNEFMSQYLKGLVPIIAFAFIQVFLIQNFIIHDDEFRIGSYVYDLYSKISTYPILMASVVGLLFTVNLSHYVYDAYIWKFNKKNPHLGKILIYNE